MSTSADITDPVLRKFLEQRRTELQDEESNSPTSKEEPALDDPLVERLIRRSVERGKEIESGDKWSEKGRSGHSPAGEGPLLSPPATSQPDGRPSRKREGKRVHFLDPSPEIPFNPVPPPPPPTKPGYSDVPASPGRNPPPPPPLPPQALDLFFPTVDDDGKALMNEDAVKVYNKFMDELGDFVEMQGNVISSRVEVQEMRERLRISRKKVSQCDMNFMDQLRTCMAQGTLSQDTKLKELFEAAQAARDMAGPMEDDYEILEVRLGAAEFALKEKFSMLETRYINFFKLHANSYSTGIGPSTISFESSSESSGESSDDQIPEDYSLLHGTTIGDAVKIGQLPLALDGAPPADRVKKSRSTGLQGSLSTHSLSQQRLSAGTGTNPRSERTHELLGLKSARFDWDPTDKETHERWMTEDLRGICNPSFISDCPEQNIDGSDTESVFGGGDSLLLLGDDTDTQSTLSDYLLKFDSTRDRVNKWLLHKLRVSPREVFELQRRISQSSQNVPDWAHLALRLWEEDIIPAPAYHHGSEEHVPGPKPTLPVPPPYPPPAEHFRRRKKSRQPFITQGSNTINAPGQTQFHDALVLDSDVTRHEALRNSIL
ncbi:hypothetical protein K469DRAFT_716439 [Zopfia rhizophila CBS 207.26]|uniref:Uncharacterized protein n=1 Tax=Zopfia rhizophila CBS 207.26 TaxID=1314779 RepID=A0A6A6DM54_9PEZI|nr:hypothetical protein K469DRAFT_716439 [Zopfia rhizophila CBS 207.26]